jgi:uncharacterized membrane protein
MNKKMKFVKIAAVLLFAISTTFCNQKTELNQRKPAIADQDLVIQISEIKENALFFPVNIDGVKMEVLAVKAPDGTIRTAFNVCQVCYPSGRGYFVQVDTELVCQNCGRHFTMDQVEHEAGGCNPVPILAADKTVTAKTITVSQEHFRKTKALFESWSRDS